MYKLSQVVTPTSIMMCVLHKKMYICRELFITPLKQLEITRLGSNKTILIATDIFVKDSVFQGILAGY